MRSSSWRTRIGGAVAVVSVAVVSVAVLGVGAVASGQGAPRPASTTVKNADILGQWVAAPGDTYGGTYTSESSSGKCEGTTPYGAGYALKDCKVDGDHLSFVITYGSDYKSYNSDTVSGNYLSGSFHDTNGTVESYTNVRETDIPTTTKMACRSVGKKATCKVTVVYDAKNDVQGAPTGSVAFSGSLKAVTCTLKKSAAADTAGCTKTLSPSKTAAIKGVKATYRGSSHFRKSIKTVKVR